MSITIGQQLGSYEITTLLGKGGMGEVYRARDSKLKRDVAIKILPDEFSRDAERAERFQREAELLAALNHPNIATIYDVQESNGTRFLVLELVEGDTLADILNKRGALPADEALQVAKQICEAVEAAHDKGVVHRDLKPANVKLTPDGNVKVLDFGLAKARETAAASVTMSNSPTISLAGTLPGVILGTAGYMSPEQAKGFEANQQSDIFSFGCILYEMLTSRRAFDGETVSETLAAVLKSEVDVSVLPTRTHPRLQELLRRCLEKNPKRRWHSAADVRVEIESLLSSGAFVETHAAVSSRPLWRRSILAVLGLLVGAIIAGTAAWTLKPTIPLTVTRFPILLEERLQFTNTGRNVVALSPDGTQIIYVANRGLYHRFMHELEVRPIFVLGTQSAVLMPVFSPDGHSVVFWADQSLKKISVSGGAPITLCPLDSVPFGVSWTTHGILFGQAGKGIMRLSSNGGKPEVLVSTKTGEIASLPHMLPGGQAVLFTLASGTDPDRWDRAQIVVQTLASGERKTLIEGGSDGRYVPSGHIVYAFSGTLRAVTFDLRKLQVTSGAAPVLEGVRRGNADGTAHYVFSDTGSLIYVPGPTTSAGTQRDLALIDRKGAVELLKLPPGSKEAARFSPDGKHVAYGIDDGKEVFVSIYDPSGTSAPRRLTFGGRNRFPLWSSDGQRIAFQSDREGDFGIFWQRTDGTGTPERLTKPDKDTAHVPESWSPKGEGFLFDVVKESTHSLWLFSFKDKKATPFGSVQSAIPPNAVFSPNGKWVAYASDETGRREVYVQPFPSTGAKYQVLNPGAINPHHPLWSPDGKEIFYIPSGGLVVSVSFTTQPAVSFGKPEPITSVLDQGGPLSKRNTDIGPDGRFIGVVSAEQAPTASSQGTVQVVLNWLEELKQRVPVK